MHAEMESHSHAHAQSCGARFEAPLVGSLAHVRTHARTQMSALRAHKGSHVLTALGLTITHSHTQSTHACTTHPSIHPDPTPTPPRYPDRPLIILRVALVSSPIDADGGRHGDGE
jgi:hypothetical protein